MSNSGISLDSLFGGGDQPQAKKPLTLDGLFQTGPGGTVKSGPAEDGFFSTGTAGRVLDAMGQGAQQGWGGNTVALDKDEQDFVKNAGISENYNDIRSGLAKAFNEAAVRPAALGLASVVHAGQLAGSAFSSVIGGAQAGAAQLGTEGEGTTAGKAIGSEQLGQTAAEMLGYSVSRGDINLRPFEPADLTKARSLGTVGEGEAGYFDTKTATPETIRARAAATKEVIASQAEQEKAAGLPEEQSTLGSPAEAQPEPEAPAPDIHAVARQIAPETFQEYDALDGQRDSLRQQLSELSDGRSEAPEAQEAQQRIDTILGKVNGVEDRLTKSAQSRLDAARDDLDDALRTDTPDMAALRKSILETDYRMRDLAPQVASAYRDAQERMPEAVEEPVDATAEEPDESQDDTQSETAPPAEAPSETQPKAPEASAPDAIAHDVAQKLGAAGRPEEEAQAAAALIQAHYEARAERFGGAKGSALELYNAEAPNIRAAGRKRVAEMAQDKTLHQRPHAQTRIFGKRGVDEGGAESARITHDVIAKLPKEVSPREQVLIDQVNAIAKQIAPGAKIIAARDIVEGGSRQEGEGKIFGLSHIDGQRRIISWSLESPDARGTMRHEAIHYLRGAGFFEPSEWAALEKAAHDGNWIGEHQIRERYPDADAELQTEEAIAEEFGKWNRAATNDATLPALVVNAFGKLKGLLSRVGDFLRKTFGANATASDVFSRAVSGDVGARRPTGEVTPSSRFQIEADGETLNQAKRGSITLGDARNTIKLFKDADASTFIHETGHQWLEELMGDAKDERAPADLLKDAQTVRDWLGVKDGEDISRKQHEKFARGFERYMMEGVAPSKSLAKVFAKFRDWLTKLYQTVNRLRSPITDDIRSVFDRLLATSPERTIIAPERSVEAHMADIHEAEAETTPPEKSANVADHIRSDIDGIAEEKAADDFKELDKASRIAGENARATGGADETGDQPGEEGVSGEPGAQPEGGNEAAEDGADLRAGTGSGPSPRGGRSAGRTTELPGGPNDRFGKPESDLVDKAGNIRLENLNTPEDINAVIRETAAQNSDFTAQRRGVLSDGETLDLADAVGMDPAFLDRRKIGQAFNAEQIIAARKLLVRSAANVRDAMTRAAKSKDVATLIGYAEAKDRHRLIQGQVAGITAEAGRALRAFRNMAGMDDAKALGKFVEEATGVTLNQLRQEVNLGQHLQTPAQVSKFVNDTAVSKFKSAVLEYWINSLISGPITHFRYAVGNAIQAIWSGGIVTPLAAGIGKVRDIAGLVNEGDRVYLGEAGAQMFSLTKGSTDGWRAAAEAFRSGVSEPLPGERLSNHGVMPKAIPGKIGEVIRLPGRSVSSIHSFFKSVRYEQNMTAMAYRTASKEGLTGTAFYQRVSDLTLRPSAEMMDAWEDRSTYDELEAALSAKNIARSEGLAGNDLAQRVSELVANPTPEMKADFSAGKYTDTARTIAENAVLATKESLRELYMAPTEYNTAMGYLTRAVNHSLLAKIIIPFMKIGSQITRNAFLEMTPLGIVDKNIRENLTRKNGGAAQDMQLARMTAGIALIGITAGLAAQGLATGDGPEDPAHRATWLLTHKPNTVMIGSVAIPYQGLGSIGMLMRFTANMYAVAHGLDGDTADKMATGFLEGISKSVLDENFMRGLKDALDAIYHWEEYGTQYLKDFATNWIPFSVGLSQVARQVDTTSRDTKGEDFWDSIGKTATAKIPYLSETLAPRRDIFGEPITADTTRTYAGDPTVQGMDAVGFAPGRLERKIRGVDLSDQQYDDYSRVAGRMSKTQLDALVSMPGFQTLPNSIRFSMMKAAVDSSRENARSLIQMQYPDIIQKANEAKLAPLMAATSPPSISGR